MPVGRPEAGRHAKSPAAPGAPARLTQRAPARPRSSKTPKTTCGQPSPNYDDAVQAARTVIANAIAAKVALSQAEQTLKDMTIRAPQPKLLPPELHPHQPLSYGVTKRQVSEGQMIKEGEAVAELVIEDPIRLWSQVPEQFAEDVRVGQRVRLSTRAHPELTFEGKIARINPSVETASRTFQVETLVPNERGLLRPGGFAKASIITDAEAKAAVVPVESIVRFAGVTKLFIVENGKARSISDIKTGSEGRGWVEVTSKQLPETAQVVTTGQTQLADGTPVVIREPEPRASSPNRREADSTSPETADAAGAPRDGSGAGLLETRTCPLGRLSELSHFIRLIITGIAMTLSDVCINRPVFTWVLVAIPVVLGLFSYGELGVDLFPDVDFPVCTVTTVLPGASVEEMETTVTKPIEDIINTVSGIDELRSTTTEGVSVVTVQFLLSKNGDVGMQEVRDKVNTILADLPDGTDPPIVDKFDTGSMPVMTIAVSGRRDFREVTEMAASRSRSGWKRSTASARSTWSAAASAR